MGNLKGLRPDVVLTLPDDQKITLRPSNAALEKIERLTDCGMAKLYRRMREDDVRFTDIAVIVSECSKAAGEPVPYGAAFALAQEHYHTVALAAIEVVAGAFGPAPAGAPANPPTPS